MISKELRSVALLLRRCEETDACVRLVSLLEKTAPIISETAPQLSSEHDRIINSLLACQSRRDWLGLADTIEYELTAFYEQAGL